MSQADTTADEPGVSPSDAIMDDDVTEEPDSGETSIMDILLSTEPADSPANHPDKEPWLAHMVIGIKKALNGAMSTELRSGTPALENFAFGGLGLLLSGEGDDSDGDGPAPQPRGEEGSNGGSEGLYEPDRGDEL